MQSKRNCRWPLAVLILSSLLWALPVAFGGIWFLLASDSSEYIVPSAAVAAVAGFMLQQTRVRARRRQAALDAYAEREIARTEARMNRPRAKRRRLTT